MYKENKKGERFFFCLIFILYLKKLEVILFNFISDFIFMYMFLIYLKYFLLILFKISLFYRLVFYIVLNVCLKLMKV